MSVVIETTVGDITVDLYLKERPNTCLNFLKLCRIKYYNLCIFYKVERNFIAQTGDPTATGRGGESVFSYLYGEQAKYFDAELKPRLKHEKLGTLSMVNNGNNMNGSQFYLTLGENLTYLDEDHTVFGEVVEGLDVLLKINETICDPNNRPYQDIRITHTVVLHDPYDDPSGLQIPDASPVPTKEQLESGYIGADEEIDDTKGKNKDEIEEKIKESEAKARATILEMVGDLPDADVKPPENVLFVCKLNPVTTSEDLEIIFSRFGKIESCEVIKDRKSGDSLQYAFIEFEKEKDCENAYFKMDNVLIDDRRIHVDFSQSVSKLNWEQEAKSKLKGLSRNQNLVIRNTQKKSDGYDMVFDMDTSSSAPRKDKRQHRVRSPDHRNTKHTHASYDSKKPHDYSHERRHQNKHDNERSYYLNRKSNTTKSKNGRFENTENKRHFSRSPQRRISPRRSRLDSDSSNQSASPKRKSHKVMPESSRKHVRHSSSSSSCSVSPPPVRSQKNIKQLKASFKSKEANPKKVKEASPFRKKKQRKYESSSSSSSSSSSESSPERKKKVLSNSVRMHSPESPHYHKSLKSKHFREYEKDHRTNALESSKKFSSKSKYSDKRYSNSSESSPDRQYTEYLKDKHDKKHKKLESTKVSRNSSKYVEDSSDKFDKKSKIQSHKSSSNDKKTSRNSKHSSEEIRRRRRSSS